MRLAFAEGKWQVVVLVVLTAFLVWVYPILALAPLVLLTFILYFYRDPRRESQGADGSVLAPADGTVTKVVKTDCPYVGKGAWEVSIFMSPLDVHVNRSPIEGIIESIQHRPGKFLPAMNPEAPLINEKRIYLIQGEVKTKVIQVAGIMARRTVNWIGEGERVASGEKIGMIKLGSCTQLVFPADYNVLVKEGDKVRAGLTPMGEG